MFPSPLNYRSEERDGDFIDPGSLVGKYPQSEQPEQHV